MRISVKKFEGVFYRERKELFNGRPDKTFEICWNEAGRKRWKTIGRLSRGVTAEAARLARMEILSGKTTVPADQGLTVAEVLADWRAARTRPTPSVKSSVKRLTADLGQVRLRDLSLARLDGYKQALRRQGLADSSIGFMLTWLGAAVNQAIRHGRWAGFNPLSRAAGFRMPVPDNKGERWLRPDEADRLLAALKVSSPTWHDLALVSLHTGARLGELYRLRAGDVSAESSTAILQGKSGRREPVSLTPEALEAILTRGKRPGELVFGGSGGKAPRDARPFMAAVDLLGLNEGVTDRRHRVWFHTLRHTFASWLVQGGTDLYTVQRLLRHASPDMTQRYAHLDPGRLRAPLEIIRQALDHRTPPRPPASPGGPPRPGAGLH
jgi:integrase